MREVQKLRTITVNMDLDTQHLVDKAERATQLSQAQREGPTQDLLLALAIELDRAHMAQGRAKRIVQTLNGHLPDDKARALVEFHRDDKDL